MRTDFSAVLYASTTFGALRPIVNQTGDKNAQWPKKKAQKETKPRHILGIADNTTDRPAHKR